MDVCHSPTDYKLRIWKCIARGNNAHLKKPTLTSLDADGMKPMVKLNMKGKPLLLMIDGELFGIEEVSERANPTQTGEEDARVLTIKAVNVVGRKKLTLILDSRLFEILKLENGDVSYIG